MGKNILLINNGYPSEQYPEYTTYIRSIEECLFASGNSIDKLVISFDRRITPTYKIYKYILFWIKCLTIRTTCETIYINHLPFAWPIILNPFIGNKRLIVHWHGEELTGNRKFLTIARRILVRFVRNAHNIVPSHYFGRVLKSRFGEAEMHVSVSPSGGVDIERFRPAKSNSENFVIGYASELKRDKGADILMHLIEHKHEIEIATGRKITFHIINYGRDAEYYMGRMQQTDMSCCKVFDRRDKSQMPSFYNSTDLIVFPSIRESLGLAALEAMSCGVPVVAHNICAFPEYIKPGVSGELVELCTSEQEQNRAFLTAVVKAIKNIETYAPRQVVETNYSQTSVISFYRKLFEDL